jgi:hypothetical protein
MGVPRASARIGEHDMRIRHTPLLVAGAIAVVAIGAVIYRALRRLADPPPSELGIEVTMEETPGGGELVFIAPPEEIADLRVRVARMAVRHTARYGFPGAPTEPPGRGRCRAGAPPMVPSRAEAENIEGGVVLRFTAIDPEDVEALREHLRDRAERIRLGICGIGGPLM